MAVNSILRGIEANKSIDKGFKVKAIKNYISRF